MFLHSAGKDSQDPFTAVDPGETQSGPSTSTGRSTRPSSCTPNRKRQHADDDSVVIEALITNNMAKPVPKKKTVPPSAKKKTASSAKKVPAKKLTEKTKRTPQATSKSKRKDAKNDFDVDP